MFRYRRYRVFLVFAAFAIFALYTFGASGTTWREAASTAAELKNEAEHALGLGSRPRPPIAHETKKLELEIPVASITQALQTPPPIRKIPTPSPPSLAVSEHPQPQHKPTIPTPIRPNPHVNPAAPANDLVLSTSIEPIHWTKLPEKFPVPSQSLIKLPSAKPRPIPKIQFRFGPEDAAAKADRLAKLDRIKTVFKKSWSGYKEFAWTHDELRPLSGRFKDPFAGWRATLVDALDTLWIMGMKDEFEEAAKAVDEIDFTTTPRADIPLFETTIRYLGGLLAAYDVSGKKYNNLLRKAVELAEVLISAFDTPNRMPKTYYSWRPQFASQGRRASTRVVLAEIGSLSMEFTRLAQLTGEHKYYDAIARITDNLEEFQNKTKLPGMWPTYLDASGCGTVYVDAPPQAPLKGIFDATDAPSPTLHLSPEGKKYVPLKLPDPIVLVPDGESPTPVAQQEEAALAQGNVEKGEIRNWKGQPLDRRQLDIDPNQISEVKADAANAIPADTLPAAATTPTLPECVDRGFTSTSNFGREEFTLGAMSDSTYEYLSKEYLLLGGQVEKYRAMYELSVDVIKEHLVFRPMLPKEEDVLFSGKLNVPSREKDDLAGDLVGENSHLTCFAGGMFGLGAKIFDRPKDLEIAKKITEGCVWSYSMTQSGIMPESFEAIPCESAAECAYNQTLYFEKLDPRADYRLQSYKDQMQVYHSQLASASSWYEAELAAMTAPPTPLVDLAIPVLAAQTPAYEDTLDRRQLADLLDDAEVAVAPSDPIATPFNRDSVFRSKLDEPQSPPTRVQPALDVEDAMPEQSQTIPAFPYIYTPIAPLSHDDYVRNRIQEERLPTGVTRIGDRKYILRPEAIESVWYMYRITGDNHWREAGWRMFLAVDQHTSTKYGNSAIDDVTKLNPTLNDDMESFWLAETLKYFYLLFETEDVVSLDEWVLNTEAHPFQRPA
ncbi:glycosyl hydrolase family 47-domain-containing protein [Ampelomyces quisqualis]|uniref:alpha-1,2-Mannosidase n=1 Tax=Ampelomyces quisqualis TaxID=50730 RepID=A0A6A5QYQ2_AMPQU|nr:glycosyl hydrolase family 47-domain-containing protein [Ampelomyces quisqualis]